MRKAALIPDIPAPTTRTSSTSPSIFVATGPGLTEFQSGDILKLLSPTLYFCMGVACHASMHRSEVDIHERSPYHVATMTPGRPRGNISKNSPRRPRNPFRGLHERHPRSEVLVWWVCRKICVAWWRGTRCPGASPAKAFQRSYSKFSNQATRPP